MSASRTKRSRLLRVRAGVDRALESLVGLIMAALVLNVLWQVTTRFLLRRPSASTEEIARYGLIWLGLLGATLAFRRGLHPSLEEALQTLAGRHGLRLRRALTPLSLVLVGLFSLMVLGVGGMRLVLLTQELGQRTAALGLPLAWIYAVVPLAGALLAFYALCDLFGGEGGA